MAFLWLFWRALPVRIAPFPVLAAYELKRAAAPIPWAAPCGSNRPAFITLWLSSRGLPSPIDSLLRVEHREQLRLRAVLVRVVSSFFLTAGQAGLGKEWGMLVGFVVGARELSK